VAQPPPVDPLFASMSGTTTHIGEKKVSWRAVALKPPITSPTVSALFI
jgi:hypothetical protein